MCVCKELKIRVKEKVRGYEYTVMTVLTCSWNKDMY